MKLIKKKKKKKIVLESIPVEKLAATPDEKWTNKVNNSRWKTKTRTKANKQIREGKD